jgi:hypothetical protein
MEVSQLGICKKMPDIPSTPVSLSSAGPKLAGSMLVLIQFDVCEEIRLDQLQQIMATATVTPPKLKDSTPANVQYQRYPIVESIKPLVLEGGELLVGEMKYYDYGVLSIVFQLPFSGDWDSLIYLAGHWIWTVDFGGHAKRIVQSALERAAPALVKPYDDWLVEDYFIFHVREIAGSPTSNEVVRSYGNCIAQVVRGDTLALSEGECHEILQSRISYYPSDLAVIGWNAALIYDSVAGAETAIQLLEYSNSQLLEFRYYDALLSKELDSVYISLKLGTGMLARWRLARSATKLQTVLLEVMELTERADNAIKFLSDMFAARLYKLAASKVGVPDYKDLVREKITTAENLYRFMTDDFNQSRAFILEFTVVIILVIELIYLFRGHPL